jgi:protein-disulfide isomerase
MYVNQAIYESTHSKAIASLQFIVSANRINSLLPTGGWKKWRHLAFSVFGTTLFFCSSAALPQTATNTSSALEKAVEKVLKAHPEMVRDALNELQRRDEASKAKQEASALAAASKAIYSETGAIVLGNPSGDVTLVEFMDYQCGYCKQMAPGIDQLIQRDGQLRVLVKQLPILGPDSIAAAQLLLSMGQGQTAQQVHQSLMSSQKLDSASLHAIEQSYQLKSVDKSKVNQAIGEVRALADQLGIRGTPALVVGGTIFRGAVDTAQLDSAIKTARNLQLKHAKTKS